MSGLLSAISRSLPYASIGTVEYHEPSKADSDPGYLGEDEGDKQRPRDPASTSHSLQNFSSNPEMRKLMDDHDSTAQSVQMASCSTPLPSPSASLRPSQSNRHPSSSVLQIETGLRSRVQVNADMTKYRRIVTKLRNISGMIPTESVQHRGKSGMTNELLQTEGKKALPNFRGSLSMRSNSDPILREASELSSKTDLNKPLKTCLKQRAQSANRTPPNGSVSGKISWDKIQELRRVKTVDFEDSMSDYVPSRTRGSRNRKYGRQRPIEVSERAPSCPGRASLTRRLPACPAVTRTDVHVIAITPTSSQFASLGPMQPREDGDADPATPTMQIVESGNGSYEVVWDDVPPEHSARIRRHSSLASQALEETGSTATGSLERVNTKLTEWSGTWNAPSDSFKPTIVVFPDDDGRRPPIECAIADDEDIEIFAPPNSERASAIHSQHPSRPNSAAMSRATSQDWFSTTKLPQDTPLDTSAFTAERTLAMPDSDAWSAHLVAARRKLGTSSPERRLSNVDEAEMKFRNHRDSVTIAHSRLIRSGGVRPELFAHSDSVSLAKKRMHAKNLATSAAHHTHRSKAKSESGNLPDDDIATLLPLSVMNSCNGSAQES